MKRDDLGQLTEAVETIVDNAPTPTKTEQEIVGNIGEGWPDRLIGAAFDHLYGPGAFEWDYDPEMGTIIIRMGYGSREEE